MIRLTLKPPNGKSSTADVAHHRYSRPRSSEVNHRCKPMFGPLLCGQVGTYSLGSAMCHLQGEVISTSAALSTAKQGLAGLRC